MGPRSHPDWPRKSAQELGQNRAGGSGKARRRGSVPYYLPSASILSSALISSLLLYPPPLPRQCLQPQRPSTVAAQHFGPTEHQCLQPQRPSTASRQNFGQAALIRLESNIRTLIRWTRSPDMRTCRTRRRAQAQVVRWMLLLHRAEPVQTRFVERLQWRGCRL